MENLPTTTTSLDLKIQIELNHLTTSTYQKPINLYLYIPPLLAQPISCFKNPINGELIYYWNQSSKEEDFILTTSLFIEQFLQWGHLLTKITPLLHNAASKIDNQFRATGNNTPIYTKIMTLCTSIGNIIQMMSTNPPYETYTMTHYRRKTPSATCV